MVLSEHFHQILHRIEKGQHSDKDLTVLRQRLEKDDEQLATQLGKYNVNIGEGKEIHIGDRLYYSWDDKALRALVRIIRFGDVDEAKILVTKLNNARLQGEDGDRKTGSFYSYNIWLEDVSLEQSQDSIENNGQYLQYNLQGKWRSRVYKEINMFGVRVDKPWGDKKKPYGNFTVEVETMDGRVSQIKVNASRYDDSPNNYAADKAEQLIHSTINQILPIIAVDS